MMLVPKEMVVERVRALGDSTRRAENDLPEKVDPEERAELAARLGPQPIRSQRGRPAHRRRWVNRILVTSGKK